MSDRHNLASLTEQLSSDKVKERQEAVAQLRSAFGSDRAVLKLTDQTGWICLFEALFAAFGLEKGVCHKKGLFRNRAANGPGASALRRLGELASVIRWLVERAIHQFSRKIIHIILSHLFRNIRSDGRLLGDISLDYAKAIKCIVGWRSHLDHLDGEMWINLVQLSFNVILDDPLNAQLNDTSASTSSPAADEPSGTDEEQEDSDTMIFPRKRRRHEVSPGPAAKKRLRQPESLPVTLEKIEFTAVLAILLRSSSSPIIYKIQLEDNREEEEPLDSSFLPAAILARLHRFLAKYPADTSLHHDYLLALSGALSQIALNYRQLIIDFARLAWPALAGMWGTKIQSLKEELVIVLRLLFPFLSHGQNDDSDEGPLRLWKALDADASGRHSLSLDCLRLALHPDDVDLGPRAFAAQTFRHGWHFDSGQALAWAILELQVDCAKMLYDSSESPRSFHAQTNKRQKLENPIESILLSVGSASSTSLRTYHFQVLLFFVDRHWDAIHPALHSQAVRTLTQCLSYDDPTIQSWAFVCLAAIAHAEGAAISSSSSSSSTRNDHESIWDTVWTLANRRSNVPAVCRAACHAAHILLHRSKVLLSPPRLLAEIESLAKDLDVQGPSFPYDSVCAFLVLCTQVASQDVTLYRMHLEDKILTWLVDNWRPSSSNRKMPLYSVQDLLALLGSSCALAQQGSLICETMLPDCAIVEAVKADRASVVIRDYLLHAKLPSFDSPPTLASDTTLKPAHLVSSSVPSADSRDLLQARGCERRISAFFLKALEELSHDWESHTRAPGLPLVERVRTTFDVSILSLYFESLLLVNGIQSNRRVIQAACKVVAQILPVMGDSRWDLNERALLMDGFSPLYRTSNEQADCKPWETLLPPGRLAGIRTEMLQALTPALDSRRSQVRSSRLALQRALFRSSDMQDASAGILQTLRTVLDLTVDEIPADESSTEDTQDGFSGVRVSEESRNLARVSSTNSTPGALQATIDVCVSLLSILPTLLPSSGGPTRDAQLMEWIISLEPNYAAFLAVMPSLLRQVQQRTFELSVPRFEVLVRILGEMHARYKYKRSAECQHLIVQLLRYTMHIWPGLAASSSESAPFPLFGRFLRDVASRKVPDWRNRDLAVQFLDEVVAQDPLETSPDPTSADDSKNKGVSPRSLLISLGGDDDIRVRFRAATASAKLLSVSHALDTEPIKVYDAVRAALSTRLDRFEDILTRLLCLGNIMIVSSVVRRGPYWHLLETCFHSDVYGDHIHSILNGVARRLGMASCSVIFEIYASQIAYSIRTNKHDFLRLAPRLLGYSSKRECAEQAFRAFTPANILAGGSDAEAVRYGRQLFANHCRIVNQTVEEGLLVCLPEIVGFQLVLWVGSHPQVLPDELPQLDQLLRPKLKELYDSGSMEQYLRQQADGIVTAVVRTLSDHDFSASGPVIQALASHSTSAAEVFKQLTRFWPPTIEVFEAALPAYDAHTVLKALNWFNQFVPHVEDRPITYHVLHRLFATINQAPLINEQIRTLNALCLWVAYHADHFGDKTLLHTLLNGAANIIRHIDLAPCAQSILHWGLSRSSDLPRDARLSEILLRIACAAQEHSNSSTHDVSKTGASLTKWIEAEVSTLARRSKSLLPFVKRAIMAWPHGHSSSFREAFGPSSLLDLSSVLAEERASPNKFGLVRLIKHLADSGKYDNELFAKRDFWTLKQCIPAADHLLDEEVESFVSLLTHHGGRIDGLEIEDSQPQTACARYVSQHNKDSDKGRSDQGLSARKAIVASLLILLDDFDAGQVHLAFRTLRSLATATTLDQAGSNGWPSNNPLELQFLRAYIEPQKSRTTPDLEQLLLHDSALASPQSFDTWITRLSTALSDVLAAHDPFYSPLSFILEVDDKYAEQILPILVHIFLHSERMQADESKSTATISQYMTILLQSDDIPLECRKAIVNTSLHLREWAPPRTKHPLARDTWLNIDYILLSQNAVRCGAYTTALLFLELASEYADENGVDPLAKEHILYQIYSHIDEPDGFYAISTQDVHGLLLKHLHHEQRWDKAFQFHGAALEMRDLDAGSVNGVLNSLRAFGFASLAMTTLQSIPGAEAVVDSSMQYQLGWRAEAWDLPDTRNNGDASTSLYFALRAVHRERDGRILGSVVSEQLALRMDHLRELGRENLVEIRKVSQVLMCLNEVRQWILRGEGSQSPRSDSESFSFSPVNSAIDFTDFEALLATRVSLLRSARQLEQREQIGTMISPQLQWLTDLETDCLLQLSRASRAAGNSQIAINSIVRAQKLGGHQHFGVACEFANVLWLTKEPKIATEFLRSLLGTSLTSPENGQCTRRACLLALMGKWASQACLERPADIKRHYFDEALSLLEKSQSEVPSSVYHDYAIFAERQYHAVTKSPDWLRVKVYIERKTAELQRMDSMRSKIAISTISFESEKKKAETLLNTDKALYGEYVKSRTMFLSQAIEMWSLCLAGSDDFDNDAIIRLCSLWFANFDDTEEGLPDKIGKALNRIASRKFVFLAHQLSARLSEAEEGTDVSENQGNLRAVMLRMCKEHPFHTLFPVFCLRADTHSGRASRVSMPASQTGRANAASTIFAQLRADASCANRITDVETVCRASVQWAKHPIKPTVNARRGQKVYDVPSHLEIRKLANIQVPVITTHIPLDPTCMYANCVWIKSYESTFSTAGGVNLPKINNCIGTDGHRYKQLFKGEGQDDLRQDAVMEQVFDLVNIVLRNDRETTRRNLRIRGYKIIPLAAQAGVLEFVSNTLTLNNWLTAAHGRYNPRDITSKEINDIMAAERKKHGNNADPETYTKAFVPLMRRFHPVMRHYFTESTKDPMNWFRMRLYYARSVATTSIVGHILGLGDRHLSNILLDNDNGEVIHIDLGIAFEQGKLLPTPERVPFRLTPDMVDGLGTMKTQGVFQRCAEETLRVLRDRSDVILTVLEVFKYDPLHSWTASEMKMRGVQSVSRGRDESKQMDGVTDELLNHYFGFNVSTSSTGVDEAADRALNAVTRKLDKSLSVEFTVNELIAEATDIVNLANMYIGWAPYC